MTVAVILAGLIPIMYGSGAGAEVMQRIAAPMVGGMVTAPLLSLFVIPGGFCRSAACAGPPDFHTQPRRSMNMTSPLLKLIGALGFAVLALNAHADQGGSASQAMGTNEAEVKAVDKASRKITLRHGPIKSNSVEMTAMTMTFPVRQPSLIAHVKAGDRVRFTIENVKNVATVTDLQVEQ
jgi:Cu/Ag efflux protein CusF